MDSSVGQPQAKITSRLQWGTRKKDSRNFVGSCLHPPLIVWACQWTLAIYSPEKDITEERNEDEVTYVQELIGVLRWATEIRRVDIVLEVLLLSQYQANPREGHLEQVLHIFAFHKARPSQAYAASITRIAESWLRRLPYLQGGLRGDLSRRWGITSASYANAWGRSLLWTRIFWCSTWPHVIQVWLWGYQVNGTTVGICNWMLTCNAGSKVQRLAST